jgi:hypothetical protein
MLATEIRNHLLQTPEAERERLLHSLKAEPAVVSAVASGPAFLSGLKPAQQPLFLQHAREALFPEEKKEMDRLTEALDTVRKAAEQAQKMCAIRGNLEKNSDGNWRPRPVLRSSAQIKSTS